MPTVSATVISTWEMWFWFHCVSNKLLAKRRAIRFCTVSLPVVIDAVGAVFGKEARHRVVHLTEDSSWPMGFSSTTRVRSASPASANPAQIAP